MKPVFRYPVVIVQWLDAHARPQAVEYLESEVAQQHRAEPCMTLGLLIHEDEQGVSLYTEETGPDSIRGLQFIPKSMILSVERFSLTKPRQPKPDRKVDDRKVEPKTPAA